MYVCTHHLLIYGTNKIYTNQKPPPRVWMHSTLVSWSLTAELSPPCLGYKTWHIKPPGKKLFMFRFEISTTTRNHQKLSEQNPKEWPVQISCCGLPHVMHVPSVLIAAKALSVAWMLQTLTNWSLTPELSPPCGPLPQVTTLGMTKKNTLRNLKATTLPPTHRFGTLSYVR